MDRKDKKKYNAYQRAYNAAHKDKRDAAVRKASYRFYWTRNRAKRLGKDFNLSLEEYKELLSCPCFYCKGPLPETGTGLDRINSDLGYVHGNVRPCCKKCNQAKSNMTEREFKEWILRIFNAWIQGDSK